MIQFFKGAVREIKHVVWPTRKETQKYFGLVLAMLIFFCLYLFAFSNVFSTLIFGLKEIVTGEGAGSNAPQTIEEINKALGNDLSTEIPVVSNEVQIQLGETSSTEESSEDTPVEEDTATVEPLEIIEVEASADIEENTQATDPVQ